MPILLIAGKTCFMIFTDSAMSMYSVAPVTPGPPSVSDVQSASSGSATAVNTTGMRATLRMVREYFVAAVPRVNTRSGLALAIRSASCLMRSTTPILSQNPPFSTSKSSLTRLISRFFPRMMSLALSVFRKPSKDF